MFERVAGALDYWPPNRGGCLIGGRLIIRGSTVVLYGIPVCIQFPTGEGILETESIKNIIVI